MAGFVSNLKLVLYLKNQCLTESLGFLKPPLRQAAKRYEQYEKTLSKKISCQYLKNYLENQAKLQK